MPERHLVVDHLKFSYEGLFNAAELYNVISSFFFEKMYDWYEKLNNEIITPSGKQVEIILEPWKNVSDYYKLQIRVKIHMIDVKEVEVEKEGQLLRLNQGLVRITIDGYVISDRKKEWTMKPITWFMAVIAERYFFKEHLDKFETWVKSDIEDLMYKTKTYLNTYKYVAHNKS